MNMQYKMQQLFVYKHFSKAKQRRGRWCECFIGKTLGAIQFVYFFVHINLIQKAECPTGRQAGRQSSSLPSTHQQQTNSRVIKYENLGLANSSGIRRRTTNTTSQFNHKAARSQRVRKTIILIHYHYNYNKNKHYHHHYYY